MRKLQLEELYRLDTEDFKARTKTPMVLVLDNIRSGHNVGAAFRTADAFALQHIHLCGITAQPPHREILKTAIGATQSVDWSYTADIVPLLQQLHKDGFMVVAVEQTDEAVLLQDFRPKQGPPLALVFGNEVRGVQDGVLPYCDAALEVPQFGTKHSLNISVCIGVVCWDLMSRITGLPS